MTSLSERIGLWFAEILTLDRILQETLYMPWIQCLFIQHFNVNSTFLLRKYSIRTHSIYKSVDTVDTSLPLYELV